MEDFSLATDRAVPLKQLIPGTEEYYYYHCLHFQNTEQFDKVDELLGPWVQRHGETGRVWEVRTRQALLTYEKQPQKALEYVRNRIGVQFNHQKEELGKEPNLPIELDQTMISRQKLLERAAPHWDNLNPFEDAALDWLVAEKLVPERRRQLLQRLTRPDYAGLAAQIVEDLNYKNSPGFGAFPIHRQLLLSQLDECLKLKPDLLNQANFVQTYLTKLQPAADDDWRHEPKILEAYLDRLWAFAQKLQPAHNSLKAHIVYHRLVLDRQRGVYDKDRFLLYLQLPRHVPYAAPKFLEQENSRRFAVDLNADFTAFTLLGPVGNDEPLVRSYLAHFFVDAAGYKEFEPFISDVYLKHLFAETKIVSCAVGEARLHPSAGEPHGEAAAVMVAAVVGRRECSLAVDRAAELAAPDDERVFEQATLFEVFDQGGARLIDVAALAANLCRQRTVLVPAAVHELHEADAALDHASREQTVSSKAAVDVVVFDAVGLDDVFRFR